MAKKNLTDLLRQEVEKSPQPAAETVQETIDDEQNAETAEQLPMSTNKSNATGSNLTKAQLQTTVTELKATLQKTQEALEKAQKQPEALTNLQTALQESQQKEASLQKEITELKSGLEQKTKSVKELEKELQKMHQIKNELEEAKKAAIQLAESNEKLTQEVNNLKKDHQDTKPQTHKPSNRSLVAHQPVRPIQKESDTPADFARNTWLL